ncbi:DUF222 domain-containing protein [Mycobacterium sp. NPDC003449]
MFDVQLAAVAAARSPGEGVRACAVLENAACAARLGHMADMLAEAYAADGSAEREQWRLDNWSAVCVRIGAAHAVTSGVASGLLTDAVMLRERLPRVAAVFAAGGIGYRLVHLICSRTMLVKDADALRALDADLAGLVASVGAMSVDQAEKDVDVLVLRHDRFAVRRSQVRSRARRVEVFVDDASGTGYLEATMSVADAHAVDERADALARTVCARDPRDVDERRSAALGAMGFGWDRLPCLCESADCDAAARPAVGGIVIHMVARQDAVEAATTSAEAEPVPAPAAEAEPADGPAESVPAPAAAAEPDVVPTGDLVAQRRALVGASPKLLPKPWYTYTWSGLLAALNTDRGEWCPAGPGVVLGGAVVPAPVVAQAAMHARIRTIVHPGQAPPEPRYRPSVGLAEFVRCRDRTCRFPGCTRPVTVTDIDHTIPYPWGPTAASNLVCLCREHHLLKTFWPGWSSEQSCDGTIVWTDPDGRTHTTVPGSRLLFPELCAPTAPVTTSGRPPPKHPAGLGMPRRRVTRDHDRRQRIDDERRRNVADSDGPT